jgi:hypothetical protein
MTIKEWIELLSKLPGDYVVYVNGQELTPEMFTVLDQEGVVRIETAGSQ